MLRHASQTWVAQQKATLCTYISSESAEQENRSIPLLRKVEASTTSRSEGSSHKIPGVGISTSVHPFTVRPRASANALEAHTPDHEIQASSQIINLIDVERIAHHV